MRRALRRGRPLGDDARAVLELVRQAPRPLPLPRVAQDLGMPYRTAWRAVESLVRGGHVAYGDRLPGAHDRPARALVPVADAQPSTMAAPTALPRGFFGPHDT